MEKILYIKRGKIAFYELDQQILEEKYIVKPFLLPRNTSKFVFVREILHMIWFIITNSWKTLAIVTWFADYHAAVIVFLGCLLGKKTIIFAGGQEAICYPEFRKGVYFKKFRGEFVRYALRNASVIVLNHQSLLYHENFYYSNEGKKDGIRFYIPDLKTPVMVIPNGIDTSVHFRDFSIPKEENRILTMGPMDSTPDFINKGFDLFLEMARRFPLLKFTLIGIKAKFIPWIESNYAISTIPNLELILSYCPPEVLFFNYNRAKIYIQASITEGMPYTLSEAMLCECIPIGSNVNGIPDAIGNTGIILLKRSPEDLEQALRKAMTMNTGHQARQHVLNNYTLEIRRKNIHKLFSEMLSDSL